MAVALKEERDIAGEFKLYNRLLEIAEQWSDVKPPTLFSFEYVYHTSARIGKRHEELASDVRTSSEKKREYLKNARHWFRRSLDALRDLEKQDGPKQIYTNRIETMEKKIADCDAALEF
jgi:hypothetical protein